MSDADELREAAEQTMSVTFAEALRNGADAIERVALLEGLLREARNAVAYRADRLGNDAGDEDRLTRIDAALGSRE